MKSQRSGSKHSKVMHPVPTSVTEVGIPGPHARWTHSLRARTRAGQAIHLLVPGHGQCRAEVQPDAAVPGPAHWPSITPPPPQLRPDETPRESSPGP